MTLVRKYCFAPNLCCINELAYAYFIFREMSYKLFSAQMLKTKGLGRQRQVIGNKWLIGGAMSFENHNAPLTDSGALWFEHL